MGVGGTTGSPDVLNSCLPRARWLPGADLEVTRHSTGTASAV
ncbi:hypothetical protein STRTUCAR8_09899 [Streptomyces turgidiscabies Car8]|uniref:Uncharacterized protein n=1 Tax=Streptomyces turgidiscabies (strain Car8) TaxID=698760 RepID=L7FGH6_STRT8|nr:hypothetical protein STRTUCAR8_09899 [Streptomyces turgidiscabies Car8]